MHRTPPSGSTAPISRGSERTAEIDEPRGGTFTHREDCPEGSPDRVLWACDQGHWLATDPPPGAGDQCPVIWHDDGSDGRCPGTLSRPTCICKEGGPLL